jgi:hypothetical protein
MQRLGVRTLCDGAGVKPHGDVSEHDAPLRFVEQFMLEALVQPQGAIR